MLTWRDLAAFAVGVVAGPLVWLAVGLLFDSVRHGSWTSLDKLCDCPKDGRVPGGGRITHVPADGFWPFKRCPVCGSRWARSYLRRIPGFSSLLVRVWAAPPAYTDDEFEARWDAHEAALRAKEAAKN